MARWSEVEQEAPELVAAARVFLDAGVHKTLATLGRDGSPRISGTELQVRDGDLWIGSMWQAVKARDLQRDPRFAIHSATEDPENWRGEAKIAGTATEVIDEEEIAKRNGEAGANGPSHLFRLDITEASTVGLDAAKTKLVIEVWTAERGVRVIER